MYAGGETHKSVPDKHGPDKHGTIYYAASRRDSSTKAESMAIDRRDFLKTTGKAISVGAATLALGGRVFGRE